MKRGSEVLLETPAQQATNRPYLQGLDLNDLWEQHILPYLSLREVLGARLVCSVWAARIPRLITRVATAANHVKIDMSIFSNIATYERGRGLVHKYLLFGETSPISRVCQGMFPMLNIRHSRLITGDNFPRNIRIGTNLQRLDLMQNMVVATKDVLVHRNLRHICVNHYAPLVDFAVFQQLRHLVTLELVGCEIANNEIIASLSALSTLSLSMCRGVTEVSNPHLMCLDIGYHCTVAVIHPTTMRSLHVLCVWENTLFSQVDLTDFPALDLLLLDDTQEAVGVHAPPQCEVHNGKTLVQPIRGTGFYDTVAQCYGYVQQGWRHQEFPPMPEMVQGTCNTDFA